MSLNYTDNKNILIEAKESCRVPIPVDRCSLEQVCAARAAEAAENLERGKRYIYINYAFTNHIDSPSWQSSAFVLSSFRLAML